MTEYFNSGKLVAVHGLKGELLLKHELGKKTSLKGLQAIFIEEKKKSFIPYFIEATKIKSEDEIYIKLEGVNTREQAIKLTQKQAWLPEPDFKKFAAKSAPASLLGYTIIHKNESLGEILELIEQPHQLLCRLEIKGKEVLIPLHEESLQKINHRKKEVLVELPDGLLEDLSYIRNLYQSVFVSRLWTGQIMADIKHHIAHFDLDSFFVSVEIRNNPSLKGKPVLVGGYERGVVAACSYEARKFGIHSAMPMKKAMQLCPQAIITNASRDQYSKYSRWVTEIIASKVPLFEKASIDEFYIDLTGMDKFFGVSQYAKDLRTLITGETGLPISCGLASARFIAKMATNEAKPNGFLEIPHGKEKEFLWPLGIEKINGVGKQTEQHLKSYGIYTIEDIAKTPIEHLEKIAGKWGEALWHKAHGIGSAAITTDWEQKSMSHENTFDTDYTDIEFLHKELVRLTEKTAYSLREDEKLTGCVTVKIRYSDFETTSRQETVDYTALDDMLIAKVKDLFNKSWQKGRPVRLLGVRFSQFIPFTMQMSLFENNVEKLNLYKAVDEIKDRFGHQLLTKAVNAGLKEKDM